MSLLTRKDLLKRDELTIEKVQLSKDSFVYVRQMNGREKDNWEASLLSTVKKPDGSMEPKQNLKDFRSKLAICTVCDENGVLLFKGTDVEELSTNMSAFKLDRIIEVANRLNKVSEKDKKELLKN